MSSFRVDFYKISGRDSLGPLRFIDFKSFKSLLTNLFGSRSIPHSLGADRVTIFCSSNEFGVNFVFHGLFLCNFDLNLTILH